MLKTGTFSYLFLFLPPREPLALSRSQLPRSPSPFKAATQAAFRELILAFQALLLLSGFLKAAFVYIG